MCFLEIFEGFDLVLIEVSIGICICKIVQYIEVLVSIGICICGGNKG